MNQTPLKDSQTVDPEGNSVKKIIEGLNIRILKPQVDTRGDLTELYSDDWNYHEAPLSYAYMVSLLPGSRRGWVVHHKQDDRIATINGQMTWVFFDSRKGSKTLQLINIHSFNESKRALLTIPMGVYHAVINLGASPSTFINFPSQPYNHADPDKYRLPLENDLIPFKFSDLVEGIKW